MAIVARNWGVAVTFEDRDLNSSTMKAYFEDALAFVDVEAAASALVAAVGALSDAVVVDYTISKEYRDDAEPTAPELADVERKGYFMFRLDDSRSTSFSVPSIKNTLVVDGTNVINRADPLVAAFIAAVQTGGTDSIGVSILKIEKAEKRHAKSRKG